MTDYRTKVQRRISNALGDDVRHHVTWCIEHDGMSYRQVAEDIYFLTGISVQPTTIARWYFYWRTGR